MKQKSAKIFVEDILDAISKIERYTQGMVYDAFSEDERTVDAVIRNLEIIGEAARNIPAEIRDEYPEIPWRRMIGLRNIMIHEYFGVDLQIVWEIIKKDLPRTKPEIESMRSHLKIEDT